MVRPFCRRADSRAAINARRSSIASTESGSGGTSVAATLVPPLPDSVEAIDERRALIAARLSALRQNGLTIDVTTHHAHPMFLLAYHGRDDRALQEAAAALYAAPQPSFPRTRVRGRIRIGFVSAFFRDHTIARLNAGLIAHLDRRQFEVMLLSPDQAHD